MVVLLLGRKATHDAPRRWRAGRCCRRRSRSSTTSTARSIRPIRCSPACASWPSRAFAIARCDAAAARSRPRPARDRERQHRVPGRRDVGDVPRSRHGRAALAGEPGRRHVDASARTTVQGRHPRRRHRDLDLRPANAAALHARDPGQAPRVDAAAHVLDVAQDRAHRHRAGLRGRRLARRGADDRLRRRAAVAVRSSQPPIVGARTVVFAADGTILANPSRADPRGRDARAADAPPQGLRRPDPRRAVRRDRPRVTPSTRCFLHLHAPTRFVPGVDRAGRRQARRHLGPGRLVPRDPGARARAVRATKRLGRRAIFASGARPCRSRSASR